MKKLFFAFPILLLASCQSERVAFRFQPVAPAASSVHPASVAPLAATAPAAKATPVPAAATAPAVAATSPLHPASRRTSRSRETTLTVPAATPLALAIASPAVAPEPNLAQRLMLKHLVRQHATAGPARTAESGLGGIGLFFIAIVLGILAGIGALVALIPGISFFGGVGLAAAGLLVIFLLYSLLSGGKKKKPAAK